MWVADTGCDALRCAGGSHVLQKVAYMVDCRCVAIAWPSSCSQFNELGTYPLINYEVYRSLNNTIVRCGQSPVEPS